MRGVASWNRARAWVCAVATAGILVTVCGGPDEGGSQVPTPDGGLGQGDCGLPVDAFIDDLRRAFPGRPVEDFALGEVPRDIFKLLDALRAGTTQAAFRSLAGVPFAIQKMTIAGAAIKLSGRSLHCPNLRRLAFGDPKTVFEVAQALNRSAGTPLTDEQLDALPFERGFVVWAVAWGRDMGEGLVAQAHAGSKGGTPGDFPGDDRVTSTEASLIADPVKQLYVAFHAGEIGRDVFPPAGTPDAGKRWQVNTQARLDALLFELGDHTPPPPPALDVVTSPTKENPIAVSGTAEPLATVFVSGGSSPASAVADLTGRFSTGIALVENQENQLRFRAQDLAGNLGAEALAVVRHDSVPPAVSILSPPDGSQTFLPTATVRVSATDEVGLAALEVDGTSLTQDPTGRFEAVVVLEAGDNLVTATATDLAGNTAQTSIVVRLVVVAQGTLDGTGGMILAPPAGATGSSFILAPAGALTSPTVLRIRIAPEALPLPSPAIGVGPALAFEPTGTAFAKPVRVGAAYVPALVTAAHAQDSGLRLWGFEPGSGWREIPGSGPNAATRVVEAEVNHFSIFQAVATSPTLRVATVAGRPGGTTTNLCFKPQDLEIQHASLLAVDSFSFLFRGGGFRTVFASPSATGFDLSELVWPGVPTLPVGLLPGTPVPSALRRLASFAPAEPGGLVVLSTGDALVADSRGMVIHRVKSGGTKSVEAGNGMATPQPAVGQSAPATQVGLGAIRGLAVDRTISLIPFGVSAPETDTVYVYTDLGIFQLRSGRMTTLERRVGAPPAFVAPPHNCPTSVVGPGAPVFVAVAAVSFDPGVRRYLVIADNRDKTVRIFNPEASEATLFRDHVQSL